MPGLPGAHLDFLDFATLRQTRSALRVEIAACHDDCPLELAVQTHGLSKAAADAARAAWLAHGDSIAECFAGLENTRVILPIGDEPPRVTPERPGRLLDCLRARVPTVVDDLNLEDARAMYLIYTDPARPDESATRGSLPKEHIRSVIHARISGVRSCYEHAVAVWPSIEGRLVIRFVIASTGVSGHCAKRVTMWLVPCRLVEERFVSRLSSADARA